MNQIEYAMAYSDADLHTVNSIAKLIAIKPSSHLRSLLADMCSMGRLNCRTEKYTDGTVARRVYQLPNKDALRASIGNGE